MALLAMESVRAANFLAGDRSHVEGDVIEFFPSKKPLSSKFAKPLPNLPAKRSSLLVINRSPLAPKLNGVQGPAKRKVGYRSSQNFRASLDHRRRTHFSIYVMPSMPPMTDDGKIGISEQGTTNRCSSVYSTGSTKSVASDKTTISDIIGLYTDIAKRLTLISDSESTRILQPKAYRDTVAPLLLRRFSLGLESPLPSPARVSSPRSQSRLSNRASKSSLRTNKRQAPAFQDFTRNLRERKAELVSPVSADSSPDQRQSATGAFSEPSPLSTPRLLPSDPSSHTGIAPNTSSLHLDRVGQYSQASRPQTLARRNPSQLSVSHEPQPGAWFSGKEADVTPSNLSTLLIHNKDVEDKPQMSLQHQDLDLSYNRQNRHASTSSDSTDSFVIYNGVGEVVKAMIREKLNKRKPLKPQSTDGVTTQSHFQTTLDAPKGRSQTYEYRDLNSNVSGNSVTWKLSWPSPGDHSRGSAAPPPPRRDPKPPSIPLTAYQIYGSDIWLPKNKEIRKEERRRNREARRVRALEVGIEPQPRAQSLEPGHLRKSSSRSQDTVIAQSTRTKKLSFAAALEGAKNSLTQSSAERRRERLKGSITLVGPAELTPANVGSRS